ncbi:hypothetical protein Salat_1723700 [Sesamum alatum]|uniref:Uncharacterized protein n=1 Tax=Sesamum alatum TaxID=300844 RepID=A0AAE2CKA4_9LAMI|nr:hypothetical protein Salat_1723700 [Sesamum alatum]
MLISAVLLLGGVVLDFLGHVFMANTTTRSHHPLSLILFLFFIALEVCSASRGLLLHYSLTGQESPSAVATTTLHRREDNRHAPRAFSAAAAERTSNQEFRDDAHEVPSGPNPESN